jgi:hypothetical protein
MEMPVYSTQWEKINLVTTFLMSGPDCGWLILIGGSGGGEGKSMATNEAVKLWRRSLGEEVDLYPHGNTDYSGIVQLDTPPDSPPHGTSDTATTVKIVLMKKGEKLVKTIIHTNTWGPEMEFMAKEWDAKVVQFKRGDEPSSA